MLELKGNPIHRNDLKNIKAKDIILLLKKNPKMSLYKDREFFTWSFANGQIIGSKEARKVLDSGKLIQVSIGNGSIKNIYELNEVREND